jgi:hypothetical protein
MHLWTKYLVLFHHECAYTVFKEFGNESADDTIHCPQQFRKSHPLATSDARTKSQTLWIHFKLDNEHINIYLPVTGPLHNKYLASLFGSHKGILDSFCIYYVCREEALCYKVQGCWFDSQWAHCIIFYLSNFPATALGSTQPLTEMSTTNLPEGGKARLVCIDDNLTVICELTVYKTYYRDSFTFSLLLYYVYRDLEYYIYAYCLY